MPSRLEQTDEGFDSQDGADANSATSRVDGVPEDSFDDQGEALDVSHPMRLEPYQPYGRKRSRGSEEEQREAPAIAKGDATRMTKRARVDKFNKGGESEVQQTSWYVSKTARQQDCGLTQTVPQEPKSRTRRRTALLDVSVIARRTQSGRIYRNKRL
jgi:hypothetical protein